MSAVNTQPFHLGPFPNNDIFQYGMQHLTVADISTINQVCKAWNTTTQSPSFWLSMFETLKIPCVEGHEIETAKEDFIFLRRITHSAKKMACLGKLIGSMPRLSPEFFNTLKNAMDPYEPHKKMSETFVVVVEPTHIQWPDCDPSLLDDLVKNGEFDATVELQHVFTDQGIQVPYSLKNLKILAKYAAAKQGIKSVFNEAFLGDGPLKQILAQCSQMAKTAKVTIMRREAPPQSFNKSDLQQQILLKQHGHEMAPLSTRFYFNLGMLLAKDDQVALSKYSHTSDQVKLDKKVCSVVIADFAVPGGICFHCGGAANKEVGAVPILSAQVLQAEAKESC